MNKKFVFIFFIILNLCLSLACEARQRDFHLVTVATKNTKGLKQLKHSCEEFGLYLKVLGMGMFYPGNGLKLLLIYDYLESIPKDDIVLFVDAYDVLILATEDEILEKFRQFKRPFVVSAETNCWPLFSREHEFPYSPTPFKFINTGSFIGHVSHIKKVLRDMKPLIAEKCDQHQMAEFFLENKSRITLDNNAELFFTLHNLNKDALSVDKASKKVKCLLTGSTPILIHGNGNGKFLYENLYNYIFGDATDL